MYNPPKADLDDFGYEVTALNMRGYYTLGIAIRWEEGSYSSFIPFVVSAFADFAPIGKIEYKTPMEAYPYIIKLKEWLVNLTNSRPNSKRWISQNTESQN